MVNVRYGYRWSSRYGHQNWALYAPGERTEAMPGRPIYPDHWSIVWWYPGTQERISLAATEKEAEEVIKSNLS